MSLAIKHDDIPLSTTADGVDVVTGTRVSLDLIVAVFTSGATAEEIEQQYPTVQLADVYAAITYYLRHRDDVDAYLEHRHQHREQVRGERAPLRSARHPRSTSRRLSSGSWSPTTCRA